MAELDLHGVKHQDVDLLVENFIFMNQDKFPLIIICGNSHKMISLAQATATRIGCKVYSTRYGTLSIQGFI